MRMNATVAAVALGLLAAGCGSAAQGTRTVTPVRTPTATIGPASGQTSTPATATTLSPYHELGLSFQAPAGFAVSHVPVGAAVPTVGLTPGGQDPSAADAQIVVADNTRANSNDAAVIAARTAGADSVAAHTAHATGYHSSISNASVSGAWGAVTLTETYTTVLPGSTTPTAVKREWVFIQIGPRHFREMLALSVPARGATLDPAQVISSVTLSG